MYSAITTLHVATERIKQQNTVEKHAEVAAIVQ